jgi:hypothetical protein
MYNQTKSFFVFLVIQFIVIFVQTWFQSAQTSAEHNMKIIQISPTAFLCSIGVELYLMFLFNLYFATFFNIKNYTQILFLAYQIYLTFSKIKYFLNLFVVWYKVEEDDVEELKKITRKIKWVIVL